MYASYQTKNQYIEKLVEKYSDMVYRLAMSRTRNKETCEDVFQEVFYRLSKKLPNFENEEHEKAWIIRVTINCSKNILIDKLKHISYELPENLSVEEKDIYEIYDSVLKLPQKYRTVIHLFYYEDLPIKDIAKILNTNENTIKTWLKRGKEKLKYSLKGGFENE